MAGRFRFTLLRGPIRPGLIHTRRSNAPSTPARPVNEKRSPAGAGDESREDLCSLAVIAVLGLLCRPAKDTQQRGYYEPEH